VGRPIVLSNGSLHVGIDEHGFVHDFYYPYVGLDNHSAGEGTRHRVGLWVDGRTSWLDEPEWTLRFQTADYALIGHLNAFNDSLGILIEFNNFVATDIDAFIRTAHVINLRPDTREVRLFMHQAFIIGDSRSNHDTAQYLPDSDALLHYHGDRAFVISGKQLSNQSFDQHSIGLFGIEGREGTYRDADDGELGCGAVEHGRVDSTIRLRATVPGHDSVWLQYWIACGTSTRDALTAHKAIQDIGVDAMLEATVSWWHDWLQPTLAALPPTIPTERGRQFIKSAMLIKSHIDDRGAIIASTDTTMLNYSRDAYAYCWPRDGANALWP
jgi:GH15 family glucan-1,4-alpha-glucosidase